MKGESQRNFSIGGRRGGNGDRYCLEGNCLVMDLTFPTLSMMMAGGFPQMPFIRLFPSIPSFLSFIMNQC